MLLGPELGSVKTSRSARPWSGFFLTSRPVRRSFSHNDALRGAPLAPHKRKHRRRYSVTEPPSLRRFPRTTRAEYQSCPFNQEDYKRVRVHLARQNSAIPPQGTILLVEDKYDISEEEIDSRGLLVHVGGDTFTAITFAASGREPERPMTLHLLHNILEYWRQLQPREWHLLHVAIVDIRDDVFIGRLYFGNAETGEIRWDCDCRPSDACWLSMIRMCPMYVRHSVWETCAQSIEKMFSSQIDIRSTLESLGVRTDPASTVTTETTDPLTTIRPSDPTVIKRLKREMSVAVREEDYSTAARIRDHPYMRKYKSIFDLRKEGKHEEASDIEQELRRQIKRDDQAEQGDV